MSYRDLLKNELHRRKSLNPRYSMRAFAKSLDIGVSALSEVLKKKRQLNAANLSAVARTLKWSELQTKEFLSEIQKSESSSRRREKDYVFIAREKRELISNWRFLATYSLAKVSSNRADPEWIASHLGVSRAEAKKALNYLLKAGLIQIQEDGSYVQAGKSLTFVEHPPSEEMMKFKLDIIRRGAKALKELPDEQLLALVGHLPVRGEDLPRLGREIWKSYLRLKSVSKNPDRLYYLAIQAFPVAAK